MRSSYWLFSGEEDFGFLDTSVTALSTTPELLFFTAVI